MILIADELLNAAELANLRGLFDTGGSRDGKATAGEALAAIKHNRELDLGARRDEIKALVLGALNRKPMLNHGLLPRVVSSPILSLYEPGMAYGTHIDSAVGDDQGAVYRSDLSLTIFLDDPGSYDGGELSIDSGYGVRDIKLPAGHGVFYPTLFSHQVRPVTRGRRRACVLWMESLVRDPQKRAILLELAQLTGWIGQREPADSPARHALVKVRENLYRMWINT